MYNSCSLSGAIQGKSLCHFSRVLPCLLCLIIWLPWASRRDPYGGWARSLTEPFMCMDGRLVSVANKTVVPAVASRQELQVSGSRKATYLGPVFALRSYPSFLAACSVRFVSNRFLTTSHRRRGLKTAFRLNQITQSSHILFSQQAASAPPAQTVRQSRAVDRRSGFDRNLTGR